MRRCAEAEESSVVRYGVYPFLFCVMMGYAWLEVSGPPEEMGRYYGYYIGGLVGPMILIETLHPMRAQWQMTRATFFRRDLPFLVVGGITIALANYAAAWALVHFGLSRGASHAGLAFVPGVILALLIPDLIWYWVHRISHEGKGPISRLFWNIHVAHHLPRQVYVLMHGVAHPVNTVIVRAILTLPLFFLGFSTEVLFVANLVVGLQGLVSHFNVDIRVGWLNYFLVGTELHRYHHSADSREAKNYGAVVPIWDLLFGTFHYRPRPAAAAVRRGRSR